jgi:predicted short-subunit dehydrogenase-like oxidoreductase (DUF2520 family)
MIKKINIIGSGNVATHLAKHLSGKIEICSVYSKDILNATILAKKINSTPVDKISDLCTDVDLNIVMVRDDVVIQIANDLPKHIPVVHTSGSVNIDVFNAFENYGILYPLQTFSKNINLEIENIPFLLEGNSELFTSKLIQFCQENLSTNYHVANSEVRSEIHLAAVISNNFLTALLSESEEILIRSGLSLDILRPLMEETLRKSFDVGPNASQTGPAKRNDNKVIEYQTNKINNPKMKEIYRLMSELIRDKSN